MNSLMLNFIADWGRSIRNGLGETWTIILAVLFLVIALYLLQNVFRASINKTKIVFKWGQLFFLIVFSLFSIWFFTLI